MMNVLVDPHNLLEFDFGEYHPFKTYRLGLAYDLMDLYGLVTREGVTVIEPRMATEKEALMFHNDGYLEVLRLANSGMWVPNLFSHGLGSGDNPVFPGVYEWGMLVAGASIDCAEAVASGEAAIAFNMAGGLHHAMPARASGFCHINDAALAIHSLLARGKRVVYIDIDAHHGDGVQYAFYNSDRVLTISVHQDGHTIFPGTGFTGEMGREKGSGYAMNIPLPPGSRDDVYKRVFSELLFPAVDRYEPDIVVTQLGADAIIGDLVAGLGMSLTLFERFVTLVRGLQRPWLALGGGGYAVENVARAWTLAWARMNDVVLPDEIPVQWQTEAAVYGLSVGSLRGNEPDEPSARGVLDTVSRTIDTLKRDSLPLINP